MAWFVLAIISAVSQSISDILSKRCVRDLNEYVVCWAIVFFSFLFFIPVLIIAGLPQIGDRFWLAAVLACALDALSLILYLRALKSSDLSLILPLQAFTPLFLIVTSPLIVGESPSFHGIVGIILIVMGSYVLNIQTAEHGLLAPFRALLTDRGAKTMFVCALIWSITTNLHKIALVESSPVFYAGIHQLVVALILVPFVYFKVRNGFRQVVQSAPRLIPIGLASTITCLSVMLAMTTGLVVYVIAIKRTSVLISICVGSFLFREMNLRERLTGASIMVIGVALTAV